MSKTEYDKVLKGDGYLFYVDIVALNFLRGVEIDYASRDTGATFVFNNVCDSELLPSKCCFDLPCEGHVFRKWLRFSHSPF